ncbi:interleukin-15 receptor subunit alpha isoform X3 [Thunnus albacares]|uniref:interleukin-15 receptor subunit alpha isoform X3 n=1 Tax=Thunnus albacares TaxID=8236 RepID=UPI001CF6AFED|nr:interleukin-15 receptor subunit alpha isoform X3 [Thunnus albacares]
MELGSLSFSVCVIMICLPGAGHCSNGDTKCPCPEIPTHPLTQPPESECRQINSTFRYKCIDGYVRKAGSSTLIRCEQGSAGPTWSKYKLECIRDPKITTTKPPKTTATTPSTSQQTTQSASISTSMTSKTGSTEPTSSGPVQWSLSDDTQDEKPQVTRESVTVTSATARTVSTSTSSLSTVKSNITLIHEYSIGNRTRAAVISCVSLFIIVAMIGLLYYRRRSVNNMPPQITEEEIPMNPELAAVCDVKQGQSLPGAQEISIL